MFFKGYSKVFSTKDNEQYKLIGDFWDEMTLKYRIDDLRGLGFNWTDTTIEYAIGFKNNQKFNCSNLHWKEIVLPDVGWEKVEGKIENLENIYNDIYKISALEYEIEMFNADGTCNILYIRDN